MANSQFSQKVSEILSFSREEATRLDSASVCPEHLLMALLRDKSGVITHLLDSFTVDRHALKKELESRVSKDKGNAPLNPRELLLDPQASNILKLAVLEARLQHSPMVDIHHLLLAILHDRVDNMEVYDVNEVGDVSGETGYTGTDDQIHFLTSAQIIRNGTGSQTKWQQDACVGQFFHRPHPGSI